MAISYNKTVGIGSTLITALGLVGVIFLGVSAHGHTWQLITGGSILGAAGVSAAVFACYVFIPRSEARINEVFEKEGREAFLWTYGISTDTKTMNIFNNSAFGVQKIDLNNTEWASKGAQYCKRVIIPLF